MQLLEPDSLNDEDTTERIVFEPLTFFPPMLRIPIIFEQFPKRLFNSS